MKIAYEPNNMQKTYLSKEKYKEIQEDLERLKSEGRRDIAERLKAAKDLGDLSENSDYQEAREEQLRLEQRISTLEETLRNSLIVQKSGGGSAIRVGTKVKMKRGKENVEYTIVGSNETDPVKGFISNESPIGKALMGKKAGETVSITTPKGVVNMEILSIE